MPDSSTTPPMQADSGEVDACRPADEHPGRTWAWPLIVAAALAGLMDGLDATALIVANPSIARGVGASLPSLEAVTTVYMAAVASLVVVAGKIGDRYGHRRLVMIGLVGFALSSALVGSSSTATEMAAWRLAQGAGAAILAANGLALVRHAVPSPRLGTAVGIVSAGPALAMIAGPFVGGALVQALGWRAIFWVNVPIALIALVLVVARAPRRAATADRPPLDLGGAAVLTGAVLVAVVGISRVGVDGWAHPVPLVEILTGLALFGVLLRLERRALDPVLPLQLFRNRTARLGLIAIFAGGQLHGGGAYFIGLFLQAERGLSPVSAGACLLPMLALAIVGGPLSGRVTAGIGARWTIVLGLGLLACGVPGFWIVGPYGSVAALIPWLLPMGLGIGLVLPTATTLVIASAPPSQAGTAAGLQHTALMTSGALAVAVFGSVLVAVAGTSGQIAARGEPVGFLDGLRAALTLGAAVCLVVAVLVAVRMPEQE